MSNAEAAEETTGLRVIEGGLAATAPKGPSSEGNWLSHLDKGTIFLYRQRGSHKYSLLPYQIVHQWGDVSLLGRHYEDQPDQLEYVDTNLFSNMYEHVKTLMVLPKITEETGESNDERNRSDS